MKLYQTQFPKNMYKVDLIYKRHILAENLEQAKELYCKKMHINTFPEDFTIQEIPFNILGLKERFSDKYILMVRSHVGKQQWVDKNGNSVELKCDDFLMDVGFYDNISELYLVSDILITDYSSSIFDFSILERPQILYAYDLDVYSREVGFVFDYKNFSPFPIV